MNYTFEKNKNYYVFTDENGKTKTFDVNRRSWIGAKGQPVKSGIGKTAVRSFVPHIISENMPYTKNIDGIDRELLLLLDSLISLGYGDIYLGIRSSEVDGIKSNFNKFLNWLNNELKELGEREYYKIYTENFIKELAKEKYGKIYAERVNPNVIDFDNFISNLNYYPIFEKYIDLYIHYINKNFKNVVPLYTISEYFKLCEKLETMPKKGDFLRNYTEVLLEYENQKNEILEKIIKKNQTEKNYGGFSYDGITVEIPTCISDFTRLGGEFHNCLGSWELHNRIETEQYCVAILRGKGFKIAIDFTRGEKIHRLGQALLPCNRSISSEQREIVYAYIDYINSL